MMIHSRTRSVLEQWSHVVIPAVSKSMVVAESRSNANGYVKGNAGATVVAGSKLCSNSTFTSEG